MLLVFLIVAFGKLFVGLLTSGRQLIFEQTYLREPLVTFFIDSFNGCAQAPNLFFFFTVFHVGLNFGFERAVLYLPPQIANVISTLIKV